MKRILVVGGGGIGSMLCRELNRLVLNNQLDAGEFEIELADPDTVEDKNIKYQNFVIEDLYKSKAKVLEERYLFIGEQIKITEAKQLEGFDLIVSAVDNSATRKLIYDYCYENDIYFIDLRSEGRAIAFFTKECPKEEAIKSLGDSISDEGRSCQLESELNKNIIQNGNVIIASIGSQLILNWSRHELNPGSMIIRI